MECAAWPCRQGPVSCSTCIEEPKYPRALLALVEGNSCQSLSEVRVLDRPSRGSHHAWHGSRYDGRGVDHGSTAELLRAT